ncbi:DUF3953 domain-containing protein [Enterococcus sp. LJL99]
MLLSYYLFAFSIEEEKKENKLLAFL